MNFELRNTEMDIFPHVTCEGNVEVTGYTIVLHRKLKLSLPYLCATQLVSRGLHLNEQKNSNNMRAVVNGEKRRLLLDISEAPSLRQSVECITRYLRKVFYLTRHEITQYFSRTDGDALLVLYSLLGTKPRTTSN